MARTPRKRESRQVRAAPNLTALPLPRAQTAGIVVAAFVIIVAVYLPLRDSTARFLDDEQYVFDNSLVQRGDWAAFAAFFTEVLNPSTVRGYYQPLTMVSLAVDCRFGGGEDNVRPFKLTNLLLHSANVGLLALWISLLLRRPVPALLAALMYGLHPLHVECVAWLSQRKALLSLFFALISLIAYTLYARHPRRATYALCAAAFGLGCLSKPTVVPLPLLMLALDHWPLRRPIRQNIAEKLPLLVIALAFGLITIASQARSAAISMPGAQHGFLDIFAAWLYALGFYTAKILLPIGLVPFYPVPVPFALSNPVVLAGVGGGVVLLAVFVLAVRWSPSFAVGGMFFVLAWLPTSGFIRFAKVLVADRFVYLPLIGLCLPLVVLLDRLLDGQKRPRLRPGTGLVFLVVLTAIVALFHQTRTQLSRWKNTDTLAAYIVSDLPPKLPAGNEAYADVWAFAGINASEQHHLHDALTYFERAAAAAPPFGRHGL